MRWFMTNLTHPRTSLQSGPVGAVLLMVGVACSAGSPEATKAHASRPQFEPPAAKRPTDVELAPPVDDEVPQMPDGGAGRICNNRLFANDASLVTSVFPISDACPSQRHQLTPAPSSTVTELRRGGRPGQYCLSGVVTTGSAFLVVSFDHINDQPTPAVHAPLDAQALDIQQIHFALDAPPQSGLSLSISQVVEDNCSAERTDCIYVPGFYLIGEDGQPLLLEESGEYTFDLAEFRPGPGSAIGDTLDRTRLAGMELHLNPDQFDFCIHDIEFRDAGGRPVVNVGR